MKEKKIKDADRKEHSRFYQGNVAEPWSLYQGWDGKYQGHYSRKGLLLSSVLSPTFLFSGTFVDFHLSSVGSTAEWFLMF